MLAHAVLAERSRQSDSRGRSHVGLGLSLALHGALAGLLLLCPPSERASTDDLELTPIDLVLLTEKPDSPAVVDELADVSDAEPVAEAEPLEPSRAEARADPPTRTRVDPSTVVQEEREATDSQAAEGLALSGLRQHGRAVTSHERRGAVGPIEGGIAQRTEVALRESAVPEARRPDTAPRSLAEAGFKKRRDGRLVYRDPKGKFKAIVQKDGRVEFRNMPVAFEPSTLKVGMPGMSEAIRAAQGNDLYQSEKRRLLEETFELRLSLALGFARGRMEAQLDRLYRDLLDIWHTPSSPALARRRLLFERWDECEESLGRTLRIDDEFGTDAQLDALRSEAGQDARKRIEAFIRRHLPRAGGDGYSAQELEALNRGRTSRARFEPYG
jgi:hypothetical protein